MTRSLSRKTILMTGTAALAVLAAVATAALAADISAGGHQNLINEQKMTAPAVEAVIGNTGPGASVVQGGSVLSSRIGISSNSQSAGAIGNAAAQAMTVDRTAIELAQAVPYSTVEPVAYVGGGLVVSNGAFNVVNAQKVGYGSILAEGTGTVSTVGVSGDVDASTVIVDANSIAIRAIGNDVGNMLSLTAPAIATVAGINSFQASRAGIDSRLGTAADPYKAAITVNGDVTGSSLSVIDNSSDVMTLANRAINALTVETATLRSGGSAYEAVAGHLEDGIGADGALVVANLQRFNIAGNDGVAGPGMSATTYGRYAIEAGGAIDTASLAIDRNSQSARIFGNVAGNSVTVSAATIENGGGELPPVGVAISSAQIGNGDLSALSRLEARFPASMSRSSLSVGGNENLALARMNDADNTLTINAATIAGSSDAGVWGAGAYGHHVVFNRQSASGTVTSLAESVLGTLGDGGEIDGSAITVEGNLTASEATANRAANTLSVTSAAALSTGAALGNRQTNGAAVKSTARSALNVSTGAAATSSLIVNDNTATALARGNAVENTLTLVSGSGDAAGGPLVPMPMSGGYAQPATAMLSNSQNNRGSVKARVIGSGSQLALNCDCADSNTLGVTANTAKAAAYGNSALNAAFVTGGADPHIALVVNREVNSGAVTARVVNAVPGVVTTGLYASDLKIGGNVVSATAIGNQAVNTISTR
ncbi:hypothetical protein [Shinella sp. NM-101]|uniref:beta strand repeat-containing protein n=1 Tax=Shinella sp. NM-101 TaxID=2744455 RepID=UPI001F3E6D90|nr:hypothetical protein [Shinella sp. NM-101]